ncbi:MATE family efflux transporter [Pendulispora brunnea]|uniref:Multidrug-efflux transporter n=1 Tax=Pendulispora brunnea TaxID=2905690 RepID=A0ABZ2KE34_9BACT
MAESSERAVDSLNETSLSRGGLGAAWALVRDAIRGAPIDHTTAPIARSVVMLAIPMVLEMMMGSVFAVADVFWVSQLGANATAIVGLTESIMMIMQSVVMAVAIGAMALVARRIGEKKHVEAARAAVQAILLGAGISACVAVAGITNAPSLLRMMGATPDVIASGSRFTQVTMGGNVTVFLLYVINAIFRGAGDAAFSMRSLWLGNFLNIVLGPCFIYGVGPFPALGVTGAAVATTIGRGTAVLFQLYLLTSGRSKIKLTRETLGLDFGLMASVLRLSGSGTIQILISTTSYVGLVRIISDFGSAPLAGYTIGLRIIMFALLPSIGVSNAAATLVGQNLGAGKPDRAEQSVWRAGFYNAMILTAVGLLFVVFAPWLVALFTPDDVVRSYGVSCLRSVSAGFLFYGYGMVLSQSFNGAGDTWTPTILNFVSFWVLQLPVAWLLSQHTSLGARGVFAALAISYSTLAVLSAAVFRRGRWKMKKV